MCGRFTLRTSARLVAEAFGIPNTFDLQPRFNIAPSQKVAAVRFDSEHQQRELVFLRWGFTATWVGSPSQGNKLINARSETAATKAPFSRAFKSRRCLIVADGFYEWQETNARKQPYFIRLKEDRPFGFAGLWDARERDGVRIESCAILTTAPNDLMAPIYNRMPVILGPADYELWLDPAIKEVERLQPLMRSFPPEEMVAYPVSTLVNSPKNDVEKCVEAL